MQLIVLYPTISGTWEFALRIANTLEQAQIEKLSNALEKGDEKFFRNLRRPSSYAPCIQNPVYCIQFYIIYISPFIIKRILQKVKNVYCIQF